MSRWWTEALATMSDVVPVPAMVVLLLITAVLVGTLWYMYPAWLPRRRSGHKVKAADPEAEAQPDIEPQETDQPDQLPDLPVAEFLDLADRLAREGRYAEAVRERLRAMVRTLIDTGVIDYRPGWTVTELAEAAGLAAPATGQPLTVAGSTFSEIWYGMREATPADDQRMRTAAEALAAAMAAPTGRQVGR